ncbi:tetratricopeptide repeat protein [Kamptonema sp. UHCC 0994]|uniref:sulfotransferase family protein n=1 Tax=Kamptonema sp. UHCC 0994 TaxID=3031329 RepID=UPI0023B92FAD|nr:tetratricopeptide repeat protein [Kamptonema sp. UHCC 0994]MDF0551886.1 tetratricopeptide repeat protein [Kamptonema sp. UHCC 0994]
MNLDYCALGDALKLEGKLEEAIAHYRKAVEVNPDSPLAYHNLGKALQQNGQLEEAIAAQQKAIILQPNFTLAYFPLRYVPLPNNSSLIDDLVSLYRQVIEILPNFPLVYVNLAAALTKQGKIEEAIATYKTAVYKQTLASNPELAQVNCDFEKLRKPDFIIIGSPRCGTTSLYRYITAHPQILAPAEKEICFFSEHFHRGMAWYDAHFFPKIDTHKLLTGEATPTYLNYPLAAQRLHQFLPQVKLILILRNPVARVFSHYQMWVRRGTEKRSFEEAMNVEIEVLANANEMDLENAMYWKQCEYIDKSLYVYSIRRWMRLFPKEQFLILRSEDFYANPAIALQQVFAFLGLPDYQLADYEKYNAGVYQPPIDAIHGRLSEFFQPYNHKLEEELSIKFYW